MLWRLFEVILGQKYRKKSEYGQFELNCIHIDQPPAYVISSPVNVGVKNLKKLPQGLCDNFIRTRIGLHYKNYTISYDYGYQLIFSLWFCSGVSGVGGGKCVEPRDWNHPRLGRLSRSGEKNKIFKNSSKNPFRAPSVYKTMDFFKNIHFT